MHTKVAIIGGGPAGLILSQLLDLQGIDNVILERRSMAYVLTRIRAGVLEQGFVDLLRKAKANTRMDEEGLIHESVSISFGDMCHTIRLKELTGGTCVTVYGQTEITRDLLDERKKMGGTIIEEAEVSHIDGLNTDSPTVHFIKDGTEQTLTCEFVAGCDGFHGASRRSIPKDVIKTYEKIYPFGWLGVMAETPPVSDTVVYARNTRGFALCSLRNLHLSRYYIQCSLDDKVDDWSDERFWDELKRRIPDHLAHKLVTGPSIEKSITPLRSFVCETMNHGRLFLAGDAAHIVPPTGAKGLNLASSDIYYLSGALIDHYNNDDQTGLENYQSKALNRVWKAVRFSWWMTNLLHTFPDVSDYDERMKDAELRYIFSSEAAQKSIAENYVGLPYD